MFASICCLTSARPAASPVKPNWGNTTATTLCEKSSKTSLLLKSSPVPVVHHFLLSPSTAKAQLSLSRAKSSFSCNTIKVSIEKMELLMENQARSSGPIELRGMPPDVLPAAGLASEPAAVPSAESAPSAVRSSTTPEASSGLAAFCSSPATAAKVPRNMGRRSDSEETLSSFMSDWAMASRSSMARASRKGIAGPADLLEPTRPSMSSGRCMPQRPSGVHPASTTSRACCMSKEGMGKPLPGVRIAWLVGSAPFLGSCFCPPAEMNSSW
mmetsp:Transcript_120443/g.268789  ORF Transcript_120443/g.268789 Transcript_120443/m.268789 type:complete len:270 (+) Transcript_120443:153-962(+)